MGRIGITFDISSEPGHLVDSGLNTFAEETSKFKDIVYDVLLDCSSITVKYKEIKLEDFEVYLNITPASGHRPIAVPQEVYQQFEESLNDPLHTPLLKEDLELTYTEILEKYKTKRFTIYRK